MNNDLISRSELKKVITANHYLLSARNNSVDYGMFTTGIMQAIDNAPTVEKPQGEWINVDAYSKWLKEQTIIGFDYEHCEVLIERKGVWQSAIETYLKERSDKE